MRGDGPDEESAREEGGELAAEEEPSSGAREYVARIEDARRKIEAGDLEEAIAVLEALPPDLEEIDELLNEIERRQEVCRQLTREATRLLQTGQTQTAIGTLEEAEQLWASSEDVRALKSELTAPGEGQRPAVDEGAATLQELLGQERYDAARRQLEKALREGPVSDELRALVQRFKMGRVRKGFLDAIADARRLYALGHVERAVECWREAARWLPDGPRRERLRAIAAAARQGRLRLDLPEMAPVRTPGPLLERAADEVTLSPELQRKLAAAGAAAEPAVRRGPRRAWLWAVSILLGALIALGMLLIDALGGCAVTGTGGGP